MTATVPCQVCHQDQTTDHAHLCGACTRQLTATLRSVPELLALLDDRIAGLDRIDHGGGYTTDGGARTLDHRYPLTAATTDSPIDLAASDAAAAIRHAVDQAAYRLARHFRAARITVPAVPYLIGHVGDLRHVEWAAAAHTAITRAVRRGEALTDAPAPVDTLGTCDTEVSDPEMPGTTVLCGHTLTARPGDTSTRCRGCGTTHNVQDRRTTLVQAADEQLYNAVDTARILARAGRTIAVSTIRMWKHRGKLTEAGVNPSGQPLYRLGDVLALETQSRYGTPTTA